MDAKFLKLWLRKKNWNISFRFNDEENVKSQDYFNEESKSLDEKRECWWCGEVSSTDSVRVRPAGDDQSLSQHTESHHVVRQSDSVWLLLVTDDWVTQCCEKIVTCQVTITPSDLLCSPHRTLWTSDSTSSSPSSDSQREVQDK